MSCRLLQLGLQRFQLSRQGGPGVPCERPDIIVEARLAPFSPFSLEAPAGLINAADQVDVQAAEVVAGSVTQVIQSCGPGCSGSIETGIGRSRRSTKIHFNEDVHPASNCDTGVAIWEFARAQAAAASSILSSWIDDEPATRRPSRSTLPPAIPQRTVSGAGRIQPSGLVRCRPASYGDIRTNATGQVQSAFCWTRSARRAANDGSFSRERRDDPAIRGAPGNDPGALAIEKPVELERISCVYRRIFKHRRENSGAQFASPTRSLA